MVKNKISVVVPVYGVERYLNKCLESITKQTYTNLEIVLVDDESPDRSGEMCDDWANRDKRIIVIHQKNAGAGAARNVALQRITGEFVAFVDSDDYLAEDMYERLMNLFDEETDIVECNFINVYDENAQFESDDTISLVFSKNDAMKEHILDRYFRQVIWNKIYRRKCIENIMFPVGNKIDDEYWTYQVLGRAHKLKHCNSKLYAYRQQDDSVMHTLNPIHRVQCVEARNCRHEYVKKNIPSLIQDSYINLLMTCVYQVQQVMKTGSVNDLKYILEICNKIVANQKKDKTSFEGVALKQRIWCVMAEISLKYTCKLRNMLGIGV